MKKKTKAPPIIMLVVKNTANNTTYSVEEAQSFDKVTFKVSL